MSSNILIVDDCETFRGILSAYIHKIVPEARIHETGSVMEALDLLKDDDYDCVFLDYQLPEMNGISFLHSLHEQQSGIQLPPPVIMLTGTNDYRVIAAAIKAGALDFMTKAQISEDNLFIVLTKAEQYYEIKKAQKKAEEQLIQAQKMESVGLLAGGIAHDFNNLLTVIFGNIKFLARGIGKIPGEHATLIGHVDAIDRASRRGAGLVKRLMIFSRQRALETKQINLNIFLQDMFVLLSHSIGVSIELQAEYGEDLWPVYMDETQLGSAIMNMAINARDAMPDGGTLSFSTENKSLDHAEAKRLANLEPGKYVVLSIRDTGHGIPEENLKKIFDPFFTTKAVGKGTGLGLSMVYGLLKESGGTITVESRKGEGTCFHLYFPKSPHLATQDPAQAFGKRAIERGSETILVVEDEDDIRHISVNALREQGYRVLEAANSDEALNLLIQNKNEKFDLLFTDIAMPGDMNGIQLAARITALVPDIKVLFASGYSENAIPDSNLIEDGQLIGKPFDEEEMLRRVQAVLRASMKEGIRS